MRFKNLPTCQNRAKDFRCVSVWMWMLQAWSGEEEEEEGERGWVGKWVGGISQPLFSCQGKLSPGALRGVYRTPSPHPTLPSVPSLPLFELALTGSFCIYTPDQQPVERTASATQCISLGGMLPSHFKQAAPTPGCFFPFVLLCTNRRMKESSVTALRLSMLADGERRESGSLTPSDDARS